MLDGTEYDKNAEIEKKAEKASARLPLLRYLRLALLVVAVSLGLAAKMDGGENATLFYLAVLSGVAALFTFGYHMYLSLYLRWYENNFLFTDAPKGTGQDVEIVKAEKITQAEIDALMEKHGDFKKKEDRKFYLWLLVFALFIGLVCYVSLVWLPSL